MLYRGLGASNIEISAVGLGAWAIGGWMWGGTDEQKSIRAIQAALDQGVNLVDTAPAYGFGHSEEIVGKAIRDRRNKVVLATKCGLVWDRAEGEFFFHSDQHGATPGPSEKQIYRSLRGASIRQELEESLRRLGTDHVDLYQTHWQDPTTSIAETMEVLLELKAAGRIRAIGVSNAGLDQLKAYGPIDADQEKYNLLHRTIETNGILAYCRSRGVALLAYSPLANGLLTAKARPDRQYGPGDLRRNNPQFSAGNVTRINSLLSQLQPLAQRHGINIGQLVIAWTLSQPGVTSVLCGARDAAQAVENAAAGNIELAPDEIEMVGKLVRV